MRTSQALQAEADAEEALATLPLSLAPAGHLWLGRARLAQGNWQEAAQPSRRRCALLVPPGCARASLRVVKMSWEGCLTELHCGGFPACSRGP